MDQLRNRLGLTDQEFLAQYDASKYDRPSATVDMVIFTVVEDEASRQVRRLAAKELKVLLIQRGDHPFLGRWALPGGFVQNGEGIDRAAARELQEETGITDIYLEQLYTWGEPDRDPRTRVISCSYLSLIDATALDVMAGDDADDARWFAMRDRLLETKKMVTDTGYVLEQFIKVELCSGDVSLSAIVKVTKTVEGRTARTTREIVVSDGLAFDHAKVLQYGLERLRTKIEWTDIAFHLMPERFTLSELQQVYEVILQRELLAPAFRKKIAPMVTETNELKRQGAHRHAKLFRFNPHWGENF